MPYVLPDTTIPIYPNSDIVLQVLNPLKSFPFTLQNTREHDIKFLPDRIVILRSAVLFSDYTPHCVMDAFQKLYIPLSYLLSGETETHGPSIKDNRSDNKIYHLHSSCSLPSSGYWKKAKPQTLKAHQVFWNNAYVRQLVIHYM